MRLLKKIMYSSVSKSKLPIMRVRALDPKRPEGRTVRPLTGPELPKAVRPLTGPELPKAVRPLTGPELAALCKGRRLQFNTERGISLIIHHDIWKVDHRTWQGVADILNEWSAGDQLRHSLTAPREVHLDIPSHVTYDEDELRSF